LLHAIWSHNLGGLPSRAFDQSFFAPESDASRTSGEQDLQAMGSLGSRKDVLVQKGSCCLRLIRRLFSITYAGHFCSSRKTSSQSEVISDYLAFWL
jgi:hypothetical protein